jgi:hypothetical protein
MRGNYDKALEDYQTALDAELKRPSSLTRMRSFNQENLMKFCEMDNFDDYSVKSPQPYKL